MQSVSTGEFIFLAIMFFSIFLVPAFVIWRHDVRGKPSRRTTKRTPDVACVTSYHDAFIIVYGYCPVCSGKRHAGNANR